MNSNTIVFLRKLAKLMEEYKANLEIEGDSYGGIQSITLEVLNPQTFDEYYDEWVDLNPLGEYPFDSSPYQFADWIDLGSRCTSKSIKDIFEHGK